MSRRRYKPELRCPVCKKLYWEKNVRSKHHILPQRFFGKEGETFELCFDCHTKLELKIHPTKKLPERVYYLILSKFIEQNHIKKAPIF